MSWEHFYLTCFALGLLLCVLSLFTGGGHIHAGHFHLGGQAHLSTLHAGAGAAHARGTGVSAVNGFTVTAFLCWFGGTGYLLRAHSGWFASFVLLGSVVSGLVGAGLIFWFLARVLLPHERALTAEDTEMAGVVGRVTDRLYAGATGEILYSQLGVRRSAPARSEDGGTIDRGAEVVVLRYERGIAYVRRWNDLDVP